MGFDEATLRAYMSKPSALLEGYTGCLDQPMEREYPAQGTYLVVRLDPYETLKYLEDPEVDAVTQAMGQKYYVAYVSIILGFLGWDPEKTSYLQMDIQLLSATPPVAQPTKSWETSETCVAVGTSSAPTRDDRPALELSTPLPWPSAYHHSGKVKYVRLRTRLHAVPSEKNQPTMDIFEIGRVDKYQNADRAEVEGNWYSPDEYALAKAAGKPSPKEYYEDINAKAAAQLEEDRRAEEEIEPDGPKWLDDDGLVSDVSSVQSDADGAEPAVNQIVDMIDQMAACAPYVPVIDWWYDLGLVSDLTEHDPQEFMDACEKLEKLRMEAEERKKSRAKADARAAFAERYAPADSEPQGDSECSLHEGELSSPADTPPSSPGTFHSSSPKLMASDNPEPVVAPKTRKSNIFSCMKSLFRRLVHRRA